MPERPIDKALEEIAAIVKKYDLAAMVTLIDQETTNYLNEVSPSWSCAQYNDETGELRIKAKRADYPTKEAHEKALTDTVSMVMALLQQATRNVENYDTVMSMLVKSMDVSHIEKRRY